MDTLLLPYSLFLQLLDTFRELDLIRSTGLLIIQFIGFSLITTLVAYSGNLFIKRFLSDYDNDYVFDLSLGIVLSLLLLFIFGLTGFSTIFLYVVISIYFVVLLNGHRKSYINYVFFVLKKIKSNWKSLLFITLLTSGWWYPNFPTGLISKNNEVFVSSFLNGERILGNSYIPTLEGRIPPQHPYFDGAELYYHYISLFIGKIYDYFGLNLLLINSLFIPILLGILVGLLMLKIVFSITQSRIASLMSPVIFFVWDSAGYLFKYRNIPELNWTSIFGDHQIIFFNTNINYGAAFIQTFFIYAIYKGLRDRNKTMLVVAAVLNAMLILTKTHAFIAVTLAVSIMLIIEIIKVFLKKKNFSLFLFKYFAYLSIAIVLIVSTHRSIFFAQDTINIRFSPFHRTIQVAMNVPWTKELLINRVVDANQITNWYLYEYSKDLPYILLTLSLLNILIFLFLKSIGFLTVMRLKKFIPDDRSILILLTLIGLSSLALLSMTWVALDSQWQFAHVSLVSLSILSAIAISFIPNKYKLTVALVMTLIAAPNGLAVTQGARQISSLPIKEMVISKKYGNTNRLKTSKPTCFLTLPSDGSTPGSYSLNNKLREIIHVAHLRCRTIASINYNPSLNIKPAEQQTLLGERREQLRTINGNIDVLNFIRQYSPTIIWFHMNNIYRITEHDLKQLDYNEALVDESSGIIIFEHI